MGDDAQLFFNMKKAQLQIQETILVLFIFIVLLILGMIFFYRYNAQGLKNDIFELDLMKFDALISTFQQNPEIRCSFLGEDASCVDSTKLLAFKELIKDEKGYYRSKIGFKNITFYKLYPERNSNICELNNFNDCGVWNVYLEKPKNYGKRLIRTTPVSLYFPDKDEYGIGEMVIEWYQ